jgi:hypothetical protein
MNGLVVSVLTGMLLSTTPIDYSLVITDGSSHGMVVGIHPSGRVELGPGVTLDEASQRFWTAVEKVAPGICAEVVKRQEVK